MMRPSIVLLAMGMIALIGQTLWKSTAYAQDSSEISKAESVTQNETNEISPEVLAARDAEYERLVAAAEAYERSMYPQTPEEAKAGKGPAREERVRLYTEALKARPNDPRNASVLFRLAQSYFVEFNAPAGEKPDLKQAAYWYEEYLNIAEPEHDEYYAAMGALAHVCKQLGDSKRAIELARNILMAPFPDITPLESIDNTKWSDIPKEQRRYALLERAKSGMLYLYYDLSIRPGESDPQKCLKRLEQLKDGMNVGRFGEDAIERIRAREEEEQMVNSSR